MTGWFDNSKNDPGDLLPDWASKRLWAAAEKNPAIREILDLLRVRDARDVRTFLLRASDADVRMLLFSLTAAFAAGAAGIDDSALDLLPRYIPEADRQVEAAPAEPSSGSALDREVADSWHRHRRAPIGTQRQRVAGMLGRGLSPEEIERTDGTPRGHDDRVKEYRGGPIKR